jgi:hypothetical protein
MKRQSHPRAYQCFRSAAAEQIVNLDRFVSKRTSGWLFERMQLSIVQQRAKSIYLLLPIFFY